VLSMEQINEDLSPADNL